MDSRGIRRSKASIPPFPVFRAANPPERAAAFREEEEDAETARAGHPEDSAATEEAEAGGRASVARTARWEPHDRNPSAPDAGGRRPTHPVERPGSMTSPIRRHDRSRSTMKRGSATVVVLWSIAIAAMVVAATQMVTWRTASLGRASMGQVQARGAARAGICMIAISAYVQDSTNGNACKLVT